MFCGLWLLVGRYKYWLYLLGVGELYANLSRISRNGNCLPVLGAYQIFISRNFHKMHFIYYFILPMWEEILFNGATTSLNNIMALNYNLVPCKSWQFKIAKCGGFCAMSSCHNIPSTLFLPVTFNNTTTRKFYLSKNQNLFLK